MQNQRNTAVRKKHGSISRLGITGMVLSSLYLCAEPVRADTASTPQCHYVNLVTLPFKTVNNKVIVAGSINGKATDMVLDTGAQSTSLTKAGVENMGLTLLHSQVSSVGIGGESDTYEVVVDDMALDKYHTKSHRRLLVLMNSFLPYNAIIGANILFSSDVEFNFTDHTVKLFRPSGCDDTFLAYWDNNASEAPLVEMSSKDARQVVMVELNGKKIRAMIDSGAPYSMISLNFAAGLGMTPQSPGVKKMGAVAGVGKHQTQTWLGQFDQLTIGGETIQHPALVITDLWGSARSDATTSAMSGFLDDQPEMLLGADFLRAHRVLFALSQKRIYFSYVGGNVFGGATGARPTASENQSKTNN